MQAKYVKIFGVRFDNVTMEEAFKRFVTFLKKDVTSTIYTPNPEMVLNAQQNMQFKAALLEGDLVVPDGIGIIYASKVHQLGLRERVGGVDLSERILKFLHTTKGSIYLFGGRPEVSEDAAINLKASYPNLRILGTAHGYIEGDEVLKVIDHINEVKPDVLFVGLGSPRQELWIDQYRRVLNCRVAIAIGGGIDIWAGHAKRAPKWMQHMGIEWLYRLLQEPRRIKRMIKLPVFAFKVITTRKI